MSIATNPQHFMALDLALPWNVNHNNNQRFIKAMKILAGILLLLFIVVPFLPTWDVQFGQIEYQPTVKAKVILEVPEMPEESKPVPEPEAPPPPPPPQAKPKPKPPTEAKQQPKPKAGGKAPQQAFAALNSLNTLSKKVDVTKLQNKNLSVTGGEVKANTKSSLGEESLSASHGLKNADIDMAVKGAALGAHKGVAVDSDMEYLDLPDENGEYVEGGLARRDQESIRSTMENYKGRLNALYNKARRSNPDLSGKFEFNLVIEPDGRVSKLELIKSDLNAPDLEQQMLAFIRSINFGKEDVVPTAVNYSYVFIPG